MTERGLPRWKIRREVARAGLQLRGALDLLFDPVAQARLAAAIEAGLPTWEGAVPPGEKIAIYLLYQPRGLSGSSLQLLHWLVAQGYAPLVVSNAPLDEKDRTLLKPATWRGLVRPNFGHDFGGYRDALQALSRWGAAPRSVLVLNDSTWMPMLPGTDILQRLEAHPADIAGTILRTRGRERFLESHLYRLRGEVLAHPAFVGYWQSLRLTSNKYFVIRRGERGFSAQMQAAGLRLGSIYAGEELPDLLARQDDDFLHRTILHGAYIDAHLGRERDRLVAERGPAWRGQVLSHVRRTLEKRQAYSSFPFAMAVLCGYPLLKKSADLVSQRWRVAYLGAVAAGDLPEPPPQILLELREAVARTDGAATLHM